jgi:hypothetical protein
MYKASAGVLLPTSIIGSLPRPAWHTVQLGSRSFLEAMVNARWREQYEDAARWNDERECVEFSVILRVRGDRAGA